MTIDTPSRRSVYENRRMTVHEDRIRFADGCEAIQGVADKPDFVLIVPVHSDGRLQLVRQYRYPVDDRFWAFPQGSRDIRPGRGPVGVARGELAEETVSPPARSTRSATSTARTAP